MIKVYLGGEGPNDIGRYSADPAEHEPGVAETLLRRVHPNGWRLEGTQIWRSIRKYRAGAAATNAQHIDAHNVNGLALEAYEHSCEMLAFLRDHDGNHLREQAVRAAVRDLPTLGFADEYGYELAVVAGIPAPNLEGWVLCLVGHQGTDAMTSANVAQQLAASDIQAKSTAAYVEIAEANQLPVRPCSLREWLDDAEVTFARLIDGT